MAAGALTEEVIELVAEHLEETAEVTRTLNGKLIGGVLSGVGVGIGIGFYFGYRFNKEKIRAEAFSESQEEIEEIREFYQSKIVASQTKPAVEEIIEKRGYSVKTQEVEEVQGPRPLPAPVPVSEPRAPLHSSMTQDQPVVESAEPSALSEDASVVYAESTKPVFRTEEMSKEKDDGWSWPYEMSQRSPDRPCVIHQDEYTTNETEYNQETYAYYTGDEVLADTDDTVIHNVDELVGLDNLQKFGHGADDFNVLYVRNSKLELEMEICRSDGSYEQEVSGLEHSSFERMPRRHRRSEDDDEA